MRPRLLAAFAVVLTAGCQTVPPTSVHQPMTARPAPGIDAAAANGAIFQASNARLATMVEDRRARYVGDTLTISIEERTNATTTANSTVERTGAVALTAPTIKGLPGKSFQELSVTASGSNTHEGSGSSDASNLFNGSITVTVIETLPNGNLVVSGEKQLGINHESEYVRFSGVVNPIYVTNLNNVSSTRVADARVEFKRSGQTDSAQVMGWLARAFLTLAPF